MASITQGAITTIMTGEGSTPNGFKPTLQILSVKKVSSLGTMDRFRLVLSDGDHFSQAMLATQQNELITSGELQELCVITMNDYIVNVVQNKRLIIVLQLEIKSGPQANKIGAPVAMPDGGALSAKPQNSYNSGPYGGNVKPSIGPYGSDNQPKSTANPYGAPKQASNPYGGANNNFGGGGNNNYGNGGGNHYGSRANDTDRSGGLGGRQESSYGGVGGGAGGNKYGGGGGYGNGGAVRGGAASNPYASRSTSTGANNGPVQRQLQNNAIMPIAQLNPYHNRWTIKARITKKSNMRTWSNAKGEGKLFSIDLLDGEGSEIKGTFFKADADKWFDSLQEGRVYTFSGGRCKVANKKYSSLKSEYEINFESSTEIVQVEDDSRIMSMTYDFVKLNQMESIAPNTVIDVIAVVKSFEECANITTRAGKELDKRNLILVDDTCTEINITLWGDLAKEDEARWERNPVVAFKGIKLSDYNGRSLSTYNSSAIVNDPDVPETGDLRAWFASAGGDSSFKSVSTRGAGGGSDEIAKKDVSARYTLESIRESKLGFNDKPDYAMVKATISFIKLDPDRDPWYTACPVENCNKKVTEGMEGGWHCEKCNATHDRCQRRYILNMTISDQTGKTWVTAFNDIAKPLLNERSADELNEVKENNTAEYEDAFAEACFQSYMVTLRIKAEMVNDEQRIKNTIQRMTPINVRTECEALLSAISKYN